MRIQAGCMPLNLLKLFSTEPVIFLQLNLISDQPLKGKRAATQRICWVSR